METMVRRTTADDSRAARNKLEFVLSDETKDRLGDVILASGWDLKNFKRNPIAMFNHDRDFPIGKWRNVHVEGKRLVGELEPAQRGTSARIDEILSLIEQGILRAVSVGFRPTKRELMEDNSGFIFQEQELLETSLVSVPANPAALQIARSLNISDDTLRRVFGEQAGNDNARTRSLALPTSTSADPRTAGKPNANDNQGQHPLSTFQAGIEARKNAVNASRDALTAHLTNLPDVPTDDDAKRTDDLTIVAERAQANLAQLQRAERLLGERTQQERTNLPAVVEQRPQYTGPAVRVPFAQPAHKLNPDDYLIRYFVGLIDQYNAKQRGEFISHAAALAARYGDTYAGDEKTKVVGEWLTRAASAVATTFTSGWASQLVQQVNASFMETLIPDSVYPRLAAAGLRVTFGSNGQINIPSRVTTPSLAGAFVLEGN